MWDILSSDQMLLRDTTARFLEDQVPLTRLRKDRRDPAGFDAAYWREGAGLGFTSLLVDEEHGGGSVSGRGVADLALIAYEFGRHASPGPLVDCNLVASALAAADAARTAPPSDAHLSVLSGLVAGTTIASYCLGAAPWQITNQATIQMRRDGQDIIVNGIVQPVESGAQASHLLVTGICEGGVSQVMIPANARGVTVAPLKGIDVTRRFASIKFDQVRVPVAAVVGTFGAAGASVARQLQQAAVVLCAEAVGAMDSAFKMTLEWAFDRYTFGRALASYQALKHRFADMKIWLEASHAISDAAADAVADQTASAAATAGAAKAYIGQQGPEFAQECVQLHGGIGVTYEHDLHFFLRRVTLNRLLYGTPAEHRRVLALGQMAATKEQPA